MMRCIIVFLLSILLSAVRGVRRLPNDFDYEHNSENNNNSIIEHIRRRLDASTTENNNRKLVHPDEHLVTSLPLLPDGLFNTKHWAGHLPADGKDGSDKKIFYWLFEPGGDVVNMPPDNEIPLILWLNGGPGCSSMDGLWLENGPFRLRSDSQTEGWTIDINELSWHTAPAYTLYVDQPVGTGLSYSKLGNYCKNDFEVNTDFHHFLEEFFLFHGDKFLQPNDPNSNSPAEWTLNRPFYFSGESHAGHYIPSMMDYILQRNDGILVPSESNGLQQIRVDIPLTGAAIGNGWMDP